MLDHKYNNFILLWLTDKLDYLTNYDDILRFNVPFGNYQVGEPVDGSCKISGSKIYGYIPTKNGYHIITKPFNLKQFREKYPDIDVHKTIQLYCIYLIIYEYRRIN